MSTAPHVPTGVSDTQGAGVPLTAAEWKSPQAMATMPMPRSAPMRSGVKRSRSLLKPSRPPAPTPHAYTSPLSVHVSVCAAPAATRCRKLSAVRQSMISQPLAAPPQPHRRCDGPAKERLDHARRRLVVLVAVPQATAQPAAPRVNVRLSAAAASAPQ